MSEETQHRALEEDLESEEGDLESYLEEESSSELLERVRELQVSHSYTLQRHRGNISTFFISVQYQYVE